MKKSLLFVGLCGALLVSGVSAFGQAATFQRFDTRVSFMTANPSPTIVSYDGLPSARLPTHEYTFAAEGVRIKPNDPNYTNPVWVNDWSTLLPGKEFAITGKEGMEFNFITPVNAFGYDFIERVASIPGYEMAFTDSTFVISVYNGATKLQDYTFTPANNVATFFGISSTQTFDKVVIEETVGTVDDELYGKLYIKRPPQEFVCPSGFISRTNVIAPVTSSPSINPPLNTWQTAPISGVGFTPRAGHAVVPVNGKIYVFGGQTLKTEMYDPMTNTWTTKAPISVTDTFTNLKGNASSISNGLMAAAVGDKVYAFGGKKVLEYNTVTDTWTTKKDNLFLRDHGDAVTVDGKIYVIGGTYSKKNQIYNPLTDTWTEGAPIPDAGYASYGFTYTQATVVGGKIYLIGGVNMKTFQYYDPCTNTWTRLPDITIGPVGGGYYSSHSTVAVNGDIYVTGGISNQIVDGATLNAHWKYSTATHTWTNLTATAALPYSAFHLKGAVVGGKIYAISGAHRANSGDPQYTLGYVYNAAPSITIDETISACNCVVVPAVAPTCGNPRAKVDFVPYVGIPAADQNSGTNAWESLTLGKGKATISDNQFFDIKNGTTSIDDGTIVGVGLENFAVSRHNGYIEFLALGRRLPAYYGYYQGTIKFENVQVDRVESGLTTATWADIGLEPSENDTATKVSDTEVSFKLAFANQGDSFRVYLKNPTSTPCTCPAGQEKAPDPKSPVCIVRALVKGVQDTEFILTGYNHLIGNCTLAAGTPQAPQTPSTEITVTAGQQRTSWMQGSPWTFQLDPLLTCPAGTTKTACMFTYGTGPLGELTCGCYPDANTNIPKNLSCRTFVDPLIHGKPVFARDASPAQFCREQGYTQSATVTTEYDYLNDGSLWNGTVWEINNHLAAIRDVSCCKLEDKTSDVCTLTGCAAGQYWCSSENTCKPAGQTCNTITCNSNNTCEAGESCNCADCTNGDADDKDRCGLSMVCTKDMDSAGTAPTFNTTTAQANFTLVDTLLAPYLVQPGNANIAAGEFGTAATELKMTQYDWKDTAGNFIYFTSFTKEEAWTKVKELLSIPTSAQVLWSKTSTPYGNTGSTRYLYSYVIQQTSGVQKQIFFATEYLTTADGWRKMYIVSKDYPLSTTTTGTEVCQNFVAPILFGKPLALGSPGVGSSGIAPFCLEQGFRGSSTVVNTSFLTGWLTLWKSNGTGWEPNQNGDKINEIRCCGVPSTGGATGATVQVGACCPVGSQWSSSQNKCAPQGQPLADKCGEGQYFCSSENKCKAAGQTCSTVTCNNNSLCEATESCNCSDCNDKIDHCGLNASNKQLFCSKDGANTTTSTPVPSFDATTAQANFDIVNGKLATYLSSPGNLNIAAGEFGPVGAELKITQDTRLDGATSFTKDEAWERAKVLLSIPTSVQILWSKSSVKYENDALGDNERYLYSYVIKQTSGVQKQVFFATEFLPGYGWRKVYLVSKDYPLPMMTTGTEVCQNFTNPQLFEKPVASYQSPAQFCLEQGFRGTNTILTSTYMTGWLTMWNAAGTAWVPNENGDRIDTIRCCGMPGVTSTTATSQVGACCPAGSVWNSTSRACLSDKCGEGQYYCHEELKCKPANQPCEAVVCEDKVVFNYTGAVQDYTVPTAVKKIKIKAWGAAGGGGVSTWNYIGAAGGYAQGELNVTGGEQFKIVVGEGGKRASALRTFGGGGHGTNSWGGSGGGLSGVFRTSFTHANSLLIAGGGAGVAGGGSGSTGDNNALGFGGGLTGNDGFIDSFGNGFSQGGTQTAGGTAVSLRHPSLSGTSGGPLSGGDASMTTCYSGGGGGGGGGYYGGGGGLGDWCTFPTAGDTDGGGGSGYLHTSLVNPSFATATTADAKTPPKKIDSDYVAGVAEGKATGDNAGGNGLVVIRECRPKPTAFCNNNAVCDTNESCNCADCNDRVDHCGLDTSGQQLICTKDTTPPCFTDKFPYCLSACLDGYMLNASGQCVVNTASDIYTYRTNTGGNTAIATCQTGEILVGGGCTNTTGGAYFQAGFPIDKNESWQTYTPTYDSDYWHSLEYPATAGGPIVASGDGYACATGFIASGVKATAVCSTSSVGETTTIRKGSVAQKSLAQCSAGEVRIAGGCRYTQGGAYYQAGFPLNKGESYSGLNATEDGFVCDTGRTTTLVEARVVCRPARAGETVTVRSSPASGSTTYSTAQCSVGEVVLGGGCKNITGGLYYYAGYPIKSGTPDVANTIFTNDAFSCGSGASGTYPQAYAICLSNTVLAAPTSGPQTGACCPPGSAWNSTANACIPSTCGEGQFYCAAQKKCLAGGSTCDNTICVNDGVCSGEESCQCADCVDGGTDDKDKCSIIGGKQAVCTDDNLTDNKPGACCVAPKKWSSTANGGAGACTECTTTQAPSEIQFGVDKPYITCAANGDTTKTHFKYRLTPTVVSTTNPVFTSESFAIGTQVLHTGALSLGNYHVECFYGNSDTTVDTSTTAVPSSCTKTIEVKNTAQGCSRVYAYRGDTLSDEMTSENSFDASFRCGSRLPGTGVTNPFALRIGTQSPAYLNYDPVYSLLLDFLGIGPLSSQTNNYTMPIGSTDISCAVKIGTGYSTNNSCNLKACAGGTCAVPQTFSVVSSGNLSCTTRDEEEYNIGCNPDAPSPTPERCAAWFQNLFAAQTAAGVTTFKAKFTFNGTNDEIGCTKYPPGGMPGGLNMYENFVCKKILPSGELIEIYAADNSGNEITSLQTTAYTVKKDNENPDLQDIKYYTEPSRINLITDITKWQKGSITAQITCLDRPLEESTSCACAKDVDPSSSEADKWSTGTPDINLGADVMYYTRTLTSSVSGQTVRVHDTADNKSAAARTLDIGIDGQGPVVTVTDSGSGTTKTVIITATDTLSKIWKTVEAPTQGTNTNGIVFRKISKADITNPSALYDESCATTNPTYATIAETKAGSFPGTVQVSIPSVNFATEAISYCIQDNAGNVTRGVYPSDAVGCFSSSNMNPVPTITTYKTPLQTAMTANNYGYSLSENATNATCFRGILSNNISTLVTSQYNTSTAQSINWTQPATLKNTTTANTNGYYYFSGISGNTLSINSTPTGTGSKAVIVEGGNIQINSNIDYSGTDKTLILIARKNTTTNVGGNIYINPSVTRIDAIIIADGAMMNATTTGTTTTTKNWIDNPTELSNRLTINGRLYSFNTRGGALNTDLTPVTANGKYFTDSTLKTDGTPAKAASMDLEGFRIIMNDGILTCPTSITYRLFTNTSLPTILKRPNGYTGGSCGF